MHSYVPIIAGSLAVLVIGCWNPKGLQTVDQNGNRTGCPNYLWLAFFALVVGMITCLLMGDKKGKSFFDYGSSGRLFDD